MAARLPRRLGTREAAELAFLEDEVIQDHMNLRRRRVRDPLKDVGVRDIRHTNLPLLSRFVSEAGAILPRKLTGVSPKKQKRLAKAIKRAHHLALAAYMETAALPPRLLCGPVLAARGRRRPPRRRRVPRSDRFPTRSRNAAARSRRTRQGQRERGLPPRTLHGRGGGDRYKGRLRKTRPTRPRPACVWATARTAPASTCLPPPLERRE